MKKTSKADKSKSRNVVKVKDMSPKKNPKAGKRQHGEVKIVKEWGAS